MALFKFLGKFFSGGTPANPLKQSQVEALIDALTYAMLVDRRIASQEQEALRAELEQYPWEGVLSVEHHINEGIGRARNIFESDSDGGFYLADISTRLETETARNNTFLACVKIAHVDDDFHESEREFLNALGKAFEIDPTVVVRLIEE